MIYLHKHNIFSPAARSGFPVLYGLMQYRRTRRIRKFGDEKLVNELMPSRSRTKGWVRNILFHWPSCSS